MKKNYLLTLLFAAIIPIFFACGNESNPVVPDNPETPVTQDAEYSVNLDPSDFTIATITSSEGDAIFVYGDKDEQGNPIMMRDVVIFPHEEEGSTEIFFDENGNPEKVIAPNGVVMLFDWIEAKRAAITLIDPSTEEQLNTVLDFENGTPQNIPAETRSLGSFTKRTGIAQMYVEPIKGKQPQNKMITRALGDQTGNLSIKQCNVATDAECWVDAYSYSGMPHSGLGTHVGRLKCIKTSTGEYQYVLPKGTVGQHHDLTEHCSLIFAVLNNICKTSNMLGPAYKEAICTQITAVLATGVVSVPVALGFEAACTALNFSLELFCHTPGMQASMYGDGMGGRSFCGLLKEMHLEWDDPLLFVPTVNALPSYVTGIPKEWDGYYPLPDLEVSWGGQPQITQFVLSPAAPAHGQSYEAIADLYCLSAGSIITLSIVGTDGYSNANVFVVGDEVNYRATLHVPGAESGVKDVCTIKLELPDGSVKTKKASLVFQ